MVVNSFVFLVLLSCELAAAEESKAVLLVWSSTVEREGDRWISDCKPCEKFWNDFQDDKDFRKLIENKFTVQYADIYKHANEARRRGVRAVPTFETPRSRIVGYRGKEWLLRRLGLKE